MATSFSTIKNRPGNSSRVIKPGRTTDIGPLTDRVNKIDALITDLETRVGQLETNFTNLTVRVEAIEQVTQFMEFEALNDQIAIDKKVLVNGTIISVTP